MAEQAVLNFRSLNNACDDARDGTVLAVAGKSAESTEWRVQRSLENLRERRIRHFTEIRDCNQSGDGNGKSLPSTVMPGRIRFTLEQDLCCSSDGFFARVLFILL